MSKIEWTEKTWNPVVGCAVTSPGCKNCYAMQMAGRLESINSVTNKMPQYVGTTKKVNGKTVWTGKIGIAPDHVWEKPLRRKKPTMYFVNSEGDLFHPNVPDDAIDRAFAVMALSPQHTFQVLTKHPERMRDWMRAHTTETWGDLGYSLFFQQAFEWPYFSDKEEWLDNHLHNGALSDALCCQPELWPNVWLGVSVEDQNHANQRIPLLLDTPAAIRFISVEPLLSKISFRWAAWHPMSGGKGTITNHLDGLRRLDWVICGGESGRNARPMHPAWARSLRDECAEAGVPFFFKQWGLNIPWNQVHPKRSNDPDDFCFRGQKNLDPKTLDGVVHNAMPLIPMEAPHV